MVKIKFPQTLADGSRLQHRKQGQHQSAKQQLPQSSQHAHKPSCQRLSNDNSDFIGCCVLMKFFIFIIKNPIPK